MARSTSTIRYLSHDMTSIASEDHHLIYCMMRAAMIMVHMEHELSALEEMEQMRSCVWKERGKSRHNARRGSSFAPSACHTTWLARCRGPGASPHLLQVTCAAGRSEAIELCLVQSTLSVQVKVKGTRYRHQPAVYGERSKWIARAAEVVAAPFFLTA
jgi:hypothetical protein